MRIFSLLQAKYNQFDSAIKSYLSKTLTSYDTSYGNNTIFGQLINVMNGVVQNMMLYIEDSLVEQNKYTAQRKKSIYGLAALSGYNPSLGKAAGVQLIVKFQLNNRRNLNAIINNHTTLTCTQNGLLYNIILPQDAIVLSMEKDNNARYIYAVQGRFESQKFISRGGKYYTQNFKFLGNLDTDYLQVKINNKEWNQVASIYDMNPEGEQWTYKVSPVGGIDLIFGNGKFGKALKDGDVIDIQYLLHDGEAGNVDVTTQTYFVFNDNLSDVNGSEIDGNAVFEVTFATDDAVTAGSDSETMEQVRQMIGLNSRSLVLASPENYKNVLNKFSFCGYNRTWTEPGSMVVNSLIIRNYKSIINNSKTYFDLTENDFKLTPTQKSSLVNYIEKSGSQLAGISYSIFDPVICKYAMYIYLKMKSISYDKDYVSSQVRKLIADFFSDIQSDIFIPKSDIVHMLKSNLPEIDGVNVYILSELNETALQKGSYINTKYAYDPSLNIYKKTTEEVDLYPGENPNLGLDGHGNIYLQADEQFPVLMGGWNYLNDNGDEVTITDPLFIIYE
jgi:hypothetical protein